MKKKRRRNCGRRRKGKGPDGFPVPVRKKEGKKISLNNKKKLNIVKFCQKEKREGHPVPSSNGKEVVAPQFNGGKKGTPDSEKKSQSKLLSGKKGCPEKKEGPAPKLLCPWGVETQLQEKGKAVFAQSQREGEKFQLPCQ